MSARKRNALGQLVSVPAEERFWAKVQKTEGCWLWTAGTTSRKPHLAYGTFWDGTRLVVAHRWAYEHFVGPIPEGLTIDHLCRTPRCVNPDHLEPVTMRENILRGTGPSAKQAAMTHCKNGHPLTEDNIYRWGPNKRRCRTCHRAASKRQWDAQVAARKVAA